MGCFEPDNCFPDIDLVQTVVSRNTGFINNFTEEIAKLERATISDFNTGYTMINSLLLKYLWCIPSSSFDRVPDVSLYDHLKTTSAISACLYKYHEKINNYSLADIKSDNELKFKVVLGDFSGIQKYIFEISNSGSGGVAKRLRARSFYVNVLLEVISHYFCHTFDVPLNNILISAGGKFYILLPNINEADLILDKIIREVEEFLFKESAGEISINIAIEDICGREFECFEEVIKKLNSKLRDNKMRQFHTVLQKEGKWNEDNFEVYKDLSQKSPCNCCGKAMVDTISERICERCNTDIELGQRLANAKYIYYGKKIPGGIKIFKDYFIKIEKELVQTEGYLISLINSTGFEVYNKPISIKHMANYIPVFKKQEILNGLSLNEVYSEQQPLTFETIAEISTGKKQLGIYKADVDNLGFLFMEGLKRSEGKSRNTVSRITTFSRMLDMFFSGFINQLICKKYNFTYSVFAGGDDLFLIGPWDKIIDMSVEINKEFHRYTAYNSCFTLSSAVIIRGCRYPIQYLAEEAEEELDSAKNSPAYFSVASKNQITFLGDTIEWADFEKLIELGRYIEQLLQKGLVSVGQIRRLIGYSRMYREFLSDNSTTGLHFLPMLSYDMARNYLSNHNRSIEYQRFIDWVLKLRKEILNNKELYYLNIIGNYALTKIRRD